MTYTVSFDMQTHCLAYASIGFRIAYRFLQTRLERQISTSQVHVIETRFNHESPGIVETVA